MHTFRNFILVAMIITGRVGYILLHLGVTLSHQTLKGTKCEERRTYKNNDKHTKGQLPQNTLMQSDFLKRTDTTGCR